MAQKRIDRKLDLAVGSVTFINLENSESIVYTVDGVFGKGAWSALAGLSNGEMAQRAMLHSLNAFGGDAAADKSIDAIKAINARIQNVIGGNWTMRGTGGGGGARVTIVDQAVANYKGITTDEVLAAVNAAAKKKGVEPKEIRKGLAKNGYIDAEIKKIQAERAKAKAKTAAKAAEGSSDVLDF